MNILLLYRTIRSLKKSQLFYQVKCRLNKPAYVALEAPIYGFNFHVPGLKSEPIPRYKSVEGDVFTFLNLEHTFAGWNFSENGMLWAYNQN